ncbi:MAG: DegV family protein [Acidimicrobiales bacterium]
MAPSEPTAAEQVVQSPQGPLVVTDGAVDLPAWLEDSPRVRVVPGEVWIGDEPFAGGSDEFWSLLRRGTYPSTTPPTVSALVDAYRHPDLVFGVHVSGDLSATVARGQVAMTRSGPGVILIDTRSISVGAGLVAAAVHRAITDLWRRESIIDFARTLPDRLHTYALVQDVEPLRRSDRDGLLPKGHLARNHPLLLAVRGRVVPLEQSKDRADGLKKLVARLRRNVWPEVGSWAVGHGDASDYDTLVDQLSRELGKPPAFLASLDPTVGAHLGPEAVVVGLISDLVDL